MTPVHLNRLNFHSNRFLRLSPPTTSLANIVLKVKAAALIIIPLIAVFFLYLIFSDPSGKQIISASSFDQSRLDSDDKKNIRFIIENLAQKSKWWLCKNSNEMNKYGDKIDNIHPLRFISFILSDNKLKNTYLPSILNDRFKKMSFMKGLSQSLDKMDKNDHEKPYLNDFMNSLKIPLSKSDKLNELIDNKDWHKFFEFLKENSKTSGFIF